MTSPLGAAVDGFRFRSTHPTRLTRKFPAAGNLAGNFLRFSAELTVQQRVDAAFPVTWSKFPAAAQQGIFVVGAGNFLRRSRKFLDRAGNSGNFHALIGFAASIR
jgi:hypothetical protein